MNRVSSFALRLAVVLAVGLVSGAATAQTPVTRLELNRLEPQGENCRTYLLIDNARGEALSSLKLDLFALDSDGVAAKRLAVELGPVPERKTLIRLFDFAGLACPRLGRVLLNDVISCETAAGPKAGCLAALETRSKAAGVSFDK